MRIGWGFKEERKRVSLRQFHDYYNLRIMSYKIIIMNRPIECCIVCNKYTDCFFINIGYCCWSCKKIKIKEINELENIMP